MRARFERSLLQLAIVWCSVAGAAEAQRSRDSSAAVAPPWQDSVRYGGGPSIGPPPSDFTGDRPPDQWCLRATAQASGDFGGAWMESSREWLRQVLSDSTDFGDGWRKVLGGAPRLAPSDSIVRLDDERVCHDVAVILQPRSARMERRTAAHRGLSGARLSRRVPVEREAR